MKVIAGNIFDDPPAAFGDCAGTVDEFCTDYKVTRRAVEMAQGGIEPGSNRASDRGLRKERNG